MAVNGKRKGNQWERDVSNWLSARFESYLKVKKGFMRKPDSGSFFGGKNDSRTETHLMEFQTFGDILCPKSFKWTIEAKHYKEPFSLNSILTAENKMLDGWIAQAEHDAMLAEKSPLIIIKFNNCAPFVLVKDLRPDCRFSYKAYRGYLLDVFFADHDETYFSHS